MDKTLELDPQNSIALVSIGIIEIASNINDFDACEKAVHYFEKAFQENPRNPLAIKYLAKHYFYQKKYDICKELSKAGLLVLSSKIKPKRCELPSFRVEIYILKSCFYFLQGKVCHVSGNFDEAFQHYEESLKHNSKNYQTLFCLAKVQFHYGNFQAAEQNLNSVLACPKHKDSYEALRLLAQIKARQSKQTINQSEALKLFRRVIELNPFDYDANFEIAALFEVFDQKQALIYYESGIKIMRQNLNGDKRFMKKWPSSLIDPCSELDLAQSMLPPEVLNNYAVLLLRDKRLAEAVSAFNEALDNVERLLEKGNKADNRVRALRHTIRFNLACCHDDANRIQDATDFIKQLIKDEPGYIDAYMRLAYLARKRGDMKRALDYIEQAKSKHNKDPNHSLPTKLYCMKGRFLQEMGNNQEAFAEYSKALEMSGKRDSYARVGIANIQYASSVLQRQNVNKQEDSLRQAMKQYFTILDTDENNCAGALGIANVLTEYGKVDEAKEIYKLLSTSEPESEIGLHAMVNQAHLLMDEASREHAINLYQAALEHQPDNLQIAMYLCKAFYKQKDFQRCKAMTVKLLAKHPNDVRLRYNLAHCLYQKANQTLALPSRRVKQTKEAIANLQAAKSIFSQFLEMKNQTSEQPSMFLLPLNSNKEALHLVDTMYREMYLAAEEGMAYMEQTLRNCEYFLIHDQNKENEELKQQQERQQKLEQQRFKEERLKQQKDESERLRREEATKKFYEDQEALMVKEPQMPVKGKTTKKGQNEADPDCLIDKNNRLDQSDNQFPTSQEEDFIDEGSEDEEKRKKKDKKRKDKGEKKKKDKKHKKDKKKSGKHKRKEPEGQVVSDVEEKSQEVGQNEGSDGEQVGKKRKRRIIKTAEIEEGLGEKMQREGALTQGQDEEFDDLEEPSKRQKQ